MKKPLAAVAGAAVALLVAVFAVQKILKEGREERDLFLTGNDGDTTRDPGTLGNYKNKRIKWNITNQCDKPLHVQFRDFRRKHLVGGGHDDIDNSIVDPYPPTTGSPIEPNGGTAKVDTTLVKGTKWPGVTDRYKYDVYAGTDLGSLRRVLDPDVEIWP